MTDEARSEEHGKSIRWQLTYHLRVFDRDTG